MRNLGLDNYKLLWHGCGTSNFISILHRGLLVAPTGIPITGHLFGEGSYSSDSFAKSMNYCYNTSSDSEVKLALLCEVALGKEQIKEPNTGYFDSELNDTDFRSRVVEGKNRPDTDFTVTMPGGYSIPLGMLEETVTRNDKFFYNYPANTEYIVEDPRQVCLKYPVQFTKGSAR